MNLNRSLSMLNICVGVGFGVENTGMNMRNIWDFG